MELTVAICTYCRGDLLPTTLDSLAAVQRPDAAWELLIVDNGCEPAVQRVAESFAGRLPVRYVGEPQVGIARARNRAIEEAQAPVVLFADDDVFFDPGWLRAMVRAIREQPQYDFWGGRIEALWEIDRPRWFDLEHCPTLGDAVVRYEAGTTPRPWDPRHDLPFYTCNLALRVAAVRKAGMFNTGMGHMGRRRGTGEDTWMIRSICWQGGRGWYAGDALLRHPVPPERVSKAYARRFAWRQGWISIDMLRREQDSGGEPTGAAPRWVYRVAAGRALSGCGQWLAGMVRGDPGRAFAGQFHALFNLSKLWHAAVKR